MTDKTEEEKRLDQLRMMAGQNMDAESDKLTSATPTFEEIVMDAMEEIPVNRKAELLVPSFVEQDTSAKPTVDIEPAAPESPVKSDFMWLHPIELIKGLFSPDRPDDSDKD